MLPAALIESVPPAPPGAPLQPLQLPPPAPPIPERSTLPTVTELLPVMETRPAEEKILLTLTWPTWETSVIVFTGGGTTLLVGVAIVLATLMLGAEELPPVAVMLTLPAATDQLA